MRDRLILTAIIVAVFAGSFFGGGLIGDSQPNVVRDARECRRVVSTVPSITETLYALDLGDRVVGVSRYCNYPPAAREKSRVGGFFDPNLEAIVALRPDLVVMLTEYERSQPAFRKLALPVLVVGHKRLTGILESIATLGSAFGAEARAERIVAGINARLQAISQKTAGLPRPRVLIAVDRTPGTGKLEDIYVAGSDGYFDEIIELAGGRNAFPPGSARFPVVSAESVLSLNPQVIVDMAAGVARATAERPMSLDDWQQVAGVEAVDDGRVYSLVKDYAFVPGPRFILLVEELARLIHPEIDWQ